MINKLKINLKLVKKDDCPFLFELLNERNPNTNISHRKLPTYKQHVKFVLSKPYFRWYIIKNNLKSIGSVYLSNQNEIAVCLKNGLEWERIQSHVLKIIMKKHPRDRFFLNSSPKNRKLMQFFKKSGFKLIQYTFEIS